MFRASDHSHGPRSITSSSGLLLILTVSIAAMASAAGLPGGYSPVSDLNDPVLAEIAQVALADWVDTASDSPCIDPNDATIDIMQASSQVVAGTNYDLVFVAHLNCTAAPVTLTAKVFEPLPYTNAPPQVQSVGVYTGPEQTAPSNEDGLL